MAVENIIQTFEQKHAINMQHSGSFYNGHKIINDPIHVSDRISDPFVFHN